MDFLQGDMMKNFLSQLGMDQNQLDEVLAKVEEMKSDPSKFDEIAKMLENYVPKEQLDMVRGMLGL